MRDHGETIQGVDKITHVFSCAHTGELPGAGLMSHSTGIAAHVAIYLKPCVDIWKAYAAFIAMKVPGLHVEKIHVSLGEIDMLADVHAEWTDTSQDPIVRQRFGGKRGGETRLIGDWVNMVRTAKPAKGESGECECCYVARTSTNVCMIPDP
jgi:hypothetical protein